MIDARSVQIIIVLEYSVDRCGVWTVELIDWLHICSTRVSYLVVVVCFEDRHR